LKKIHLLVVKAFIRPFIVTFFIVMFVLLMLFLFKYIDDLIGKGFEYTVILKLLWYASATNVAMALPLAMLLSSIMTFGSLGENYELVAIKASGVSLQKAMMPLVVLIAIMSIAAFQFSNYWLPKANLKMGTLLYNIRSQKASFLIKEGVFNNSFPGYTLRVMKKDKDEETLHDILIYDHTNPNGSVSTLMAKEGKMYVTDDGKFLVLRMLKGVNYEEKASDRTNNPRQVFMRTFFNETEKKFDLSVFKIEAMPEDAFRQNYMMLNLKTLSAGSDSVQRLLDSSRRTSLAQILPSYSFFMGNGQRVKGKDSKGPIKKYKKTAAYLIDRTNRISAIQNAISEADRFSQSLDFIKSKDNDLAKIIRRYDIEYQRKFTLAFSCLVLFSIGAPLGAIIRKGGLGMPVVMSIIFFLIYHVISTIAEKAASEGSINTVLGMWLAIIVLTPLGVFLTYKATADSALFNIDNYKQFIVNLFRKKTVSQ
jgi:lipopolysaccharide export system permease protein